MDQHTENESSSLLEIVGYAIPIGFASIAVSCDSRAEALFTLTLMTSIISIRPEWDLLHKKHFCRQPLHAVPTLIVTAWLLLIGFGVIQ